MAKNTCAICKKTEETPMRMGASYEVKADNGKVLKFWMCNPCAIPLSPPQGPITIQNPALKT